MSAAGLSKASAAGRPPLQAWVPRKRNLASFDALDELSDLTSQKQRPAGAQVLHLPALTQSGPNQQLPAGLPFRAPTCLPGQQEPALPRNCSLGPLKSAPAYLPEDLDGATGSYARHAQEDSGKPCGSAAGADLTSGSQLARRPGVSTLSRRLHSKPFAAPRPVQKPDPQMTASDRPVGSNRASAAYRSDTCPVLEDSSAVMHDTIQLHPGKRRDDSHAALRQPGGALDTEGVISDSEASEANDTGPDRPPSGSELADAALADESCSTSPLKVSSPAAIISREPQQLALPDRQDAVGKGRADSHSAQPLCAADCPSSSVAETALPTSAAAACAAPPLEKRLQPTERKRLKRLYISSDYAHMPQHTAGSTQNMEVRAQTPCCTPVSFIACMISLPW